MKVKLAKKINPQIPIKVLHYLKILITIAIVTINNILRNLMQNIYNRKIILIAIKIEQNLIINHNLIHFYKIL